MPKRDPNRPPYVLIRHDVTAFFDKIKAAAQGSREVGGILIGSYRGPHIEISNWTEPGRADRGTLFSFLRKDSKHQSKAMETWESTAGLQTHVGEWHSHPMGGASPSSTDISTWQKFSARNDHPSVFAVIGPAEWGIFWASARSTKVATRMKQIEVGIGGLVFE